MNAKEQQEEVLNLKSQVEVLTAALEAERREKRDMQHYIDYLRRHRFGSKGERIDPAQLRIPFEDLVEIMDAEKPSAPLPEALEAADAEEPEDRLPKRFRKKGAHGRKPMPAELPRERVEHGIAAEDRCCPSCDQEMARIGEVTSEEVEYVPASVIVREHIRPKYACRGCQEGVLTTPPPPKVIDKGRAGPGLLSQILVSKYADHLPLHRQQAIFERQGYPLNRSTMCDWVGACARLLFPIVQEMRKSILSSGYVNADETPILMQTNSQGGGKQRAWLWGYAAGDEVVYDFRTSRGRDGPIDFLDGLEGYLQIDDYAGYNAVCKNEGVTKVACWAHARRGFFEAVGSSTADATTVLAKIHRLYAVEKMGREQKCSPDDLQKLRQSRSRPILASIHQDLERLTKSMLPKSPLGKATSYTLNLWDELNRYVSDGRLAIDNNSIERAMRGVAVGRKNWLFCGSQDGGQRAAVLYSLVETCKRIGVDPFEYFRDVLIRTRRTDAGGFAALTPHNWRDALRAEKAVPAAS